MEMFTFFFSSEKLLVLKLTPPVEGKKPKLRLASCRKVLEILQFLLYMRLNSGLDVFTLLLSELSWAALQS